MNAVIYDRTSATIQYDHSAQLEILRDYASKHGYHVVGEYVDEGQDGRTLDRPAFQEMMALTETGEVPFGVILVSEMSRLARNRMNMLHVAQFLRDHDIKIISIN